MKYKRANDGEFPFGIEYLGDGTVQWFSEVDGVEEEGIWPLMDYKGDEPVVQVKVSTTPPETPHPRVGRQVPATPRTTTVETPEGDEEIAQATPKGTRQAGRPKTGFLLMVNCVPTKAANRNTKLLSTILQEAYQAIMEEKGVASPFEIDDFARMRMIRQWGSGFATRELSTEWIICEGVGRMESDAKALFDSFLPHAGTVIMPVV